MLKENFYPHGPVNPPRVVVKSKGGKRSREDDEDAGPSKVLKTKSPKSPKSKK